MKVKRHDITNEIRRRERNEKKKEER